MQFFQSGLQIVELIDSNPPQLNNGGFSAANVKLTRPALFFIIIKIGDIVINFASDAETVKKL